MTSKAARATLLFTDAHDWRTFKHILAISIPKVGWRCHAYCLMGTHYHLLIETPEANIALGMQRINWLYSRTFNQRHGLRGHCFETRYWSELIQSERHFLNTLKYVVMNPVDAGLCESPVEWDWSSYRATVGLAELPTFLDTTTALGCFDDRPEDARRLLRWWVEGGDLEVSAA